MRFNEPSRPGDQLSRIPFLTQFWSKLLGQFPLSPHYNVDISRCPKSKVVYRSHECFNNVWGKGEVLHLAISGTML